VLRPQEWKRLGETWELDCAYEFAGKARFRVNCAWEAAGLAVVMRVIPRRIKSLSELGAPATLTKLSESRSGLILVTGPTGSGKSTTLAAMLNHINTNRACHILTIEDPIEFVHDAKLAQVTHREVGIHAPSFAAAIRSAGREDADVILIGELRNKETMKLALEIASGGALVFATVHTNSAPQTVERIVNAFPAEEQSQARGLLAEGLSGIVAQQLVATAAGRLAVHEILIGSNAVSAIIREGKTQQLVNVIQSGGAVGMQTLDAALEKLVKSGALDADAAWEKASDKESFARAIGRTT
jgi:twitching motility protein PilT